MNAYKYLKELRIEVAFEKRVAVQVTIPHISLEEAPAILVRPVSLTITAPTERSWQSPTER